MSNIAHIVSMRTATVGILREPIVILDQLVENEVDEYVDVDEVICPYKPFCYLEHKQPLHLSGKVIRFGGYFQSF